MRVLVACEFSGIVRRAFRDRGHDAISCDLLPAEDGSQYHFQKDILEVLRESDSEAWDLMIAHPPCTYLANSGVRWLYTNGVGSRRNEERWTLMREAAQFFLALWNSGIPRIAIENPVMHGHARQIIKRAADQRIHPYQFGHGETKETLLWLRNLPVLKYTNVVSGRVPRVHHEPPSADRWKNRSRTYQGIADAMADQWGKA